MISTILAACSVIIGGQIQCDVTNESKVILAGDIIYTKITMTNTFDHDVEVEPFQPVANYQIFVQANGIRGIAVGRPVGGLWSSDPAALAPRQTLSTIAVYSPWEVFQEDEFKATFDLQRISKIGRAHV